MRARSGWREGHEQGAGGSVGEGQEVWGSLKELGDQSQEAKVEIWGCRDNSNGDSVRVNCLWTSMPLGDRLTPWERLSVDGFSLSPLSAVLLRDP